jgi:CHAT domain-containing protein
MSIRRLGLIAGLLAGLLSVAAGAQEDDVDFAIEQSLTSATISELRALANAEAPKTTDKHELAIFYHKRVLAFATHGIAPGELPGMDQPALVLSNPALTGDTDNDGFLTMEEVLGLKLNADWVVLSACNTASADGRGSEAVSGLGRAFFYAGA